MYIGENTLKPLSLQKTMSTANVQNLLSNVFRPTFVYDIGNQVYRTKLELLNIDTVSANMISTYFASVGDVRSNVYVGISAGNPYSNMVSSSNYYTTFLGAGAGFGSSNVSNSVFLGYNAGQGSVNSTNTIAIGSNADGDGSNNIYIGAGAGMAGAAGTSNIFIGHGNTLTGVTKQFLLGPLVGGLGVNTNPLDFTFNVNGDMQVTDGYGRLRLTHDNNGSATAGYSRMTLVGITNSGGSPPAVGIATLQVSDGYFSASGTTGSMGSGATSNIGVWKKGIVMVSVQDTETSANYAGQISMVCLTGSTYTVGTISSNVANATITASTSNIVLTNNGGASRTYTYSITYFALP
jgi:hypothetical protein